MEPGIENESAWTRILIQMVDSQEEQPHFHTLVDLGVSWDGQEIRFNPMSNRSDQEWAKSSWLNLDRNAPENDAVHIRQFFTEHLVSDHDSPLVRLIARRLPALPARKETHERSDRKIGKKGRKS